MKQIGEGIYVQDFDDHRSYVVEAEFSEHIKSFKSAEDATQEIELRQGSEEQAQPIADYINQHDFDAKLGSSNVLFIETEDPTRLMKDLCAGGYIDVEQATAIIAYEIEHIRNPQMQAKVHGAKQLKEVREVVIQYKLNTLKSGQDARRVGSSVDKDQGKIK